MATCVTGGAAGDDANRRLAAFDRILAARERWGVMAALDASFAMEVGVITDPWKNAPAATRGTPGAGEARGGKTLITLPHPSGLNRAWDAPDSRDRARALLAPYLKRGEP